MISWVAFGGGLAAFLLMAFTALYSAPLQATTIALDFTSLPSAQGWILNTSGPAEASAYSVDGTKLKNNTIGSGRTYAYYTMPFPFDPTKPFTIEARTRVTAAETIVPGVPGSALYFVASTLGESFGISMNSTAWHAYDDMLVPHPIDATVFHTFRIEAMPGVSQDIFIDGDRVFSGPAGPYSSVPPILALGDGSSFENIAAEITKLEFRQKSTVSVATLAGLSLDAYRSISLLVDGYGIVDSFIAHGFSANAYQSGDNIIVAIRGTDSLKDLIAVDLASFPIGPASAATVLLTADSVRFLTEVVLRFPGKTITLTGHSLGGAIAQLLGKKANLRAVSFDAPGPASLESSLAGVLAPVLNLGGLAPQPIENYRLYGDAISLTGIQLGQSITVNPPLPLTKPDIDANPLLLLKHLHDMERLSLQLRAGAPE